MDFALEQPLDVALLVDVDRVGGRHRGRPGMVMTSPQMGTMNSAPPDSLTSLMGTVKPDGAP